MNTGRRRARFKALLWQDVVRCERGFLLFVLRIGVGLRIMGRRAMVLLRWGAGGGAGGDACATGERRQDGRGSFDGIDKMKGIQGRFWTG